MKIVFAASEAAPYCKTGGLGDVAEALPKELARVGTNSVTLFLPFFKNVKYNPEIKTKFVKSFFVDLSWRRQHVGLFKAENTDNNLSVYFIDNEYYFGRDGIYGYPDDGERFAYFSKAILESLLELKIVPDIIHCNDWQTGLVPIFLHSFYQKKLGRAKVVFTIHNIEYQGKCDPYFLGDTLGLSEAYENTMMFNGCVNFLKGAILSSDAITTVSNTYAQELCYPYFAHGLSDIISAHAFKTHGIVNGINQEINDPNTDKYLFANYNLVNFATGKAKNKQELQKRLGLDVRPDVPVIGMVTRLVSHKGLDLICSVLYELMNWDIQLVVLGTGDKRYEECLKYCSERYHNKFSMNLKFDPALASMIYASSDLYLMPSKSEPCGLSQLIAMRYGTVPIVNATGGLKDTVEPFNPESKTGTGFNFQSYNADDMLGAIRRALSIYGGDKSAFKTIIKNAMSRDSSWAVPAQEYLKLYKSLK